MMVSVLIAAYQASRYLRQCLDSLVAQTQADFQAICVDDASTDDTWTILQDYAARDARFLVLRLSENQGQAHARNVALQHVRGEYTCFLDSDDWLAPDALLQVEQCFRQHADTDSVLFRVQLCNAEGQPTGLYPQRRFDVLTGNEAFELSLDWQIHGVYAVRTSIHRRFPYDESARSYSDDNTTRLHYLASRYVRECPGTYFYRQHQASTTHQVSIRRFDHLTANLSMRQQMLEMGVDRRLVDRYENVRWLNVIDAYMFFFNHRRMLCKADRQQGIGQIRSAWAGIQTGSLTATHRLKFGYIPLRPFWWLFRLEEEVYFALRRLLGR